MASPLDLFLFHALPQHVPVAGPGIELTGSAGQLGAFRIWHWILPAKSSKMGYEFQDRILAFQYC